MGGLLRLVFFTCVFLWATGLLAAPNFTFSGIITDSLSGEALPGVNIYLPEQQNGTVTDTNGEFTLFLPQSIYHIKISYVGYQSLDTILELDHHTTFQAKLVPDDLYLGEVVVAARARNRNIEQAEMSTMTLNMKTLKNLPAFLGEIDVLKGIQLLPGVQSAGDGSTGFFVRGGNTDQNLVLLDDAVIYNASHLFNIFSVFNPDAIQDLTLYKGGIPSGYGGRLASVVDVRMNEGNTREFEVHGGIGLISSRFTLQGPLQYDNSAFLISARRTYADLFLKLSPEKTQRNSKLYFYDLNGKMNFVINERNRIFFSGYHGRDVTAFSDLFDFDWGNTAAVLRWNHIFSENFISDFSVIHSNYQFNISGDIEVASFHWNSSVNDIGIKLDFKYNRQNQDQISFGFQSVHHSLHPGNIHFSIQGAASSDILLTTTYALEHGVHFNSEHTTADNRFSLVWGLRGSAFQVLGPGNQYVYDKTNPFSWEVTDTIVTNKGEVFKSFYGLEPRVTFRWMLGNSNSIKGSYNRMVQYLQQAQSSQSVAPYDVWFSVGKNIPPQTADQYALGYFQNFMRDKLQISVETYYKDMNKITDIIDNGNILGNEFLDSQLRTGKGWSYGVELFVKKETERIDGFMGYTWARTLYKIDEINDGIPYWAHNDRRHDVSLSGGYKITSRLNLGMNFTYATGRAYTLPVGKMYYENVFAPIYAQRNSGRLPDYHRLDISLVYNVISRNQERRRFQSSWNFSVYNIYGRVNPISVSFVDRRDIFPGEPGSSFFYIPGPIPAITWNFTF